MKVRNAVSDIGEKEKFGIKPGLTILHLDLVCASLRFAGFYFLEPANGLGRVIVKSGV